MRLSWLISLALAMGLAWARAGMLVLEWDPVPQVERYNLYWGTASSDYIKHASVTNKTFSAVRGLIEGQTYYFAVTAVGTNFLESDYSAEVSGAPMAERKKPTQIVVEAQLASGTKVFLGLFPMLGEFKFFTCRSRNASGHTALDLVDVESMDIITTTIINESWTNQPPTMRIMPK